MTKLLFTLGVITLGLSLGYSIQRLVASRRLTLPLPIADVRRLLQKIGLLFFMYFSFMATVWIIRIDNLRLVALPAIGLFILLFGGVLALGFARVFKLSRRQTGAYFACGSFSNIGSIGALVVFVFLGEEAFAYVPPRASSSSSCRRPPAWPAIFPGSAPCTRGCPSKSY